MAAGGSVTAWLERLKAGEQRNEAVSQLWGRYFARLVAQARQSIRSRLRGVDGEDVALSAFDSFVKAAEAGRFPQLDGRNDLWQILLVLTARKAANALRDEHRERRGGGRLIQGLGDRDSDFKGPAIQSADPDPAEAAALAEEVEKLLDALGSKELRDVAVWALEGYTNQEIAERLGKSVATAERKIRCIREIWSSQGLG
jgi:DNA-directed RNA polymerase specialized sigma24 family protein